MRGADGKDGRGGGRPGRRKERGDAVNDTGLRFNGQAPVIDIAVTPPEIEGLSVDDYEVVSERVHCRLAALECRHVVIRYRHVTVKIRETGALGGRPGPRRRVQEQLRRRLLRRRPADRQVPLAPAALPPAPDAGRRRHRRQPGLAEPVGQPGDRAV